MMAGTSTVIVALAATLAAVRAESVRLVRVEYEAAGVAWDMPPSVTAEGRNRAMISQWRIDSRDGAESLLEQKVTGPYLPTATIGVRTLDWESGEPRTRVDQPFSVHVETSGLLTGAGFPPSVSRVLLERRITAGDSVEAHVVKRAWIDENGTTLLKFPVSGLTADHQAGASD